MKRNFREIRILKLNYYYFFLLSPLGSRAPWEQKQRIVGMVKSPVEGNSIVLLKMDQPVVFSDFARPICLPSSDEFIHMGASCVTLAWDGPGTYVLKDVICIFWLGRVCKYFSGSIQIWSIKSLMSYYIIGYDNDFYGWPLIIYLFKIIY